MAHLNPHPLTPTVLFSDSLGNQIPYTFPPRKQFDKKQLYKYKIRFCFAYADTGECDNPEVRTRVHSFFCDSVECRADLLVAGVVVLVSAPRSSRDRTTAGSSQAETSQTVKG